MMNLTTGSSPSVSPLIDDISSSKPPMEDSERREYLIRLLGAEVCRSLGIYRLPENLVLSVVIPVYNERNTLGEILRRVRAVPIPKQIILVDDGSTDGTQELLRQLADE